MSAYRQVADRQIDDLTDKDTGIDRQTGGRANGQAGMHTWLGDWEPKILDPSFEYDDIRSPHSLSVSPRHYLFSPFFIVIFWARIVSLNYHYHWGRFQRSTEDPGKLVFIWYLQLFTNNISQWNAYRIHIHFTQIRIHLRNRAAPIIQYNTN